MSQHKISCYTNGDIFLYNESLPLHEMYFSYVVS